MKWKKHFSTLYIIPISVLVFFFPIGFQPGPREGNRKTNKENFREMKETFWGCDSCIIEKLAGTGYLVAFFINHPQIIVQFSLH